MHIRTFASLLLAGGLVAAPASGNFGSGPTDPPRTPGSGGIGSPPATSTARQEAEKWYGDAYNDIARYLSQQTNYDEASKTAGALQGDRTAVGLQSKLRQMLQQASTASPQFRQLSDLGLELQRGGQIKLNESKLTAALQDPAAVAAPFTTAGTGSTPSTGHWAHG